MDGLLDAERPAETMRRLLRDRSIGKTAAGKRGGLFKTLQRMQAHRRMKKLAG
jgi:hypothetical protein